VLSVETETKSELGVNLASSSSGEPPSEGHSAYNIPSSETALLGNILSDTAALIGFAVGSLGGALLLVFTAPIFILAMSISSTHVFMGQRLNGQLFIG
jgi:hypothetical protein